MPPNTNVPQTAHLRKLIRKSSRRTTRQFPALRTPTTKLPPPPLRNTPSQSWLSISDNVPCPSTVPASPCSAQPDSLNDDRDEECNRSPGIDDKSALQQAFNTLASQMERDGRPFAALAARAAASLAREGRQDIVNAGLWKGVNSLNVAKHGDMCDAVRRS